MRHISNMPLFYDIYCTLLWWGKEEEQKVKTLQKATQALSPLLSSSAGKKLGSCHSLIIPILLLLLLFQISILQSFAQA